MEIVLGVLAKESIRGSPSVASLDYEVVEDSQHVKLSRRDTAIVDLAKYEMLFRRSVASGRMSSVHA